MGTERGQSSEESIKTSTQHVHTGTSYLVLRTILGTAVCSNESTTQHDTAPHLRARHGTAWHRTALCCAAELYMAGLS